jgi:hypothetical protein
MVDEHSHISEEIMAFQDEFQQIIQEGQKFCFVTRAKEFQLRARDTLKNLSKKIATLKKKAVAAAYEDAANEILSYEEIANAIINELSMWIALKEDNPGAAWDYLVNAQMAAISAMQAHPSANHLDTYLEHLDALEHHMFPKQLFFSPGIIIREARCSICGQEYGECDHVAGRPYMGELCSREIVRADLEEASLVDNPANKHARGILITGKDGVRRDFLSWRPAPEMSHKQTQEVKKPTKPYLM